jgi:hypothetical protein
MTDMTETEADIGSAGYSVEPPDPGGHMFLFRETEHPEGGRPRSIAFKDVTVVPRGYEELVATRPGKPVTIDLDMRGGRIVDTDIEDLDRNRLVNLKATLESHFTANSIGLVAGGWLPSILAATSADAVILLDRNVVTEIVSRFDQGEARGRPADFLDMLSGMDVSINPCLYAMEGSEQRSPDSDHIREELEQVTRRLTQALPKAKLMVGPLSVRGIAGLVSESREDSDRSIAFLLEVAPLLGAPVGRRRQECIWKEVVSIGRRFGLAPQAFVLLAALSAVVTPQSAPARSLLKFRPGYGAELAYNAVCDLRAIEYFLNCMARLPDAPVQLCTADRALALFWTALGASSHLERGRLAVSMRPHPALLPGDYVARWNGLA